MRRRRGKFGAIKKNGDRHQIVASLIAAMV